MTVNSYRDLEVWEKGIELVCNCYRLTRNFPREEMFGLTSQLRRAAIAVPANIAEGHGRGQTRDYVRFLRIVMGSLKEAETHLIIANKIGHCSAADVAPLLSQADELGRMLRVMIARLEDRCQ